MASGRGVALVTGAARRVGRAIALDLAAAGYDVAVHYRRSAAEAQAVVAEIEALGRRAAALGAELADEDQAAALIGRAAAALEPVGVLINNAAIFELDRPESATRASWERHMAVNLRAPFVLTQALLAQLPESIQGNVVNLIDQRVWNLTPNYTSYSVSKFGLLGLTRHLAIALAPRVRVNAVGPGQALPAPGVSTARFERLAGATPLGSGGPPEDVCHTIRFLLEVPSITGQMIAPDGGHHLGWLLPTQLDGGG